MPRPLIDFCVLDTLAAGQEAFRDVVRLLNHAHLGWRDLRGGEPFEVGEVEASLVRCIRDGLVECCEFSAELGSVEPLGAGTLPQGEIGGCRFQLTGEGQLLHARWEPPAASRA